MQGNADEAYENMMRAFEKLWLRGISIAVRRIPGAQKGVQGCVSAFCCLGTVLFAARDMTKVN